MTIQNLKWPTIASWLMLLFSIASFVGLHWDSGSSVVMSVVPLLGAFGGPIATAIILVIGLGVIQPEGVDVWRHWAIISLVIAVISGAMIYGYILYAFFHLPVH